MKRQSEIFKLTIIGFRTKLFFSNDKVLKYIATSGNTRYMHYQKKKKKKGKERKK